MGLYLLSWTTASILAAVLIYFANYYLRVPDQANYFVLIAEGAAILFIPFWVWVARRLDKRRAFILGAASWIVVLLAIAALQADQVMLAYLLAALSGSGIATAYVLPWAMVPDVIEFDQLQTGERHEGSYYAFASFFQKLATGAAPWMMAQAFATTGYLTPSVSAALPVQPPAVVIAIRLSPGRCRRSCWCWPSCSPGRSDYAEPPGDGGGTGGTGGVKRIAHSAVAYLVSYDVRYFLNSVHVPSGLNRR